MRFVLFIREDEKSAEVSRILRQKLLTNGNIEDLKTPEIVVVVGGDGTFLAAIEKYLAKIDELAFVGLHTGTVGFFCDYQVSSLDRLVTFITNGGANPLLIPLLQADVEYEGGTQTIYAVNEIRLENPYRTLICDVWLDDHFFERFRGDGLNISSSIGSSGYNKSLNGAIIESGLGLLQITEVAPIHNNMYRSLGSPLVLKGDRQIVFTGDYPEAIVGYDHLTLKTPKPIKSMRVRLSDRHVRVYTQNERSYFETLRKTFIVD